MKVNDYTIRWRYHRPEKKSKLDTGPEPDNRTYTTCIIDGPEQKTTQTAICHPNDNFCRDTGRRISLARAMLALGIDKKERKEIWEAYRAMTPGGRW